MLKSRSLMLSCGLWLLSAHIQAGQLASWAEAAFRYHPDRKLAIAEGRLGDALGRKADQWLAGSPSANIKYQTDSLGGNMGYREWEGGMELPLWWPGQQNHYRNESHSSRAVADAMLRAIRLEISGGVRERAWAVALAEAKRDQAALTVDAAEQLLLNVSRRVAAGELPRSDRLLAENSLLTAQDLLLQAENRLLQRQAAFTSYTGLKGDIRPRPEPLAPVDGITPAHPLLYLSEQRVQKARAHRNRILGARGGNPNVWLGAKTTRADLGMPYDTSLGIELRIPFGAAAHTAPVNAEAEQALIQAVTQRDRLQRELETALRQAQLENERYAAVAQRAARRRMLAEESLKLSRRAFYLGETDLVHLLLAQADANTARQSLILSRLQHQRAIAMLNQALGVIPR